MLLIRLRLNVTFTLQLLTLTSRNRLKFWPAFRTFTHFVLCVQYAILPVPAKLKHKSQEFAYLKTAKMNKVAVRIFYLPYAFPFPKLIWREITGDNDRLFVYAISREGNEGKGKLGVLKINSKATCTSLLLMYQ